MKHEIEKSIKLNLLLDGSESVMFCQGGRHSHKINASQLIDALSGVNRGDDVVVTVQLDPKSRSYFKHVTNNKYER